MLTEPLRSRGCCMPAQAVRAIVRRAAEALGPGSKPSSRRETPGGASTGNPEQEGDPPAGAASPPLKT